MPKFMFHGWFHVPCVGEGSFWDRIWRVGSVIGKVKDGTKRHVVGIRLGTGYSMVNASSIHFINSTLDYDREKMKTNHLTKPKDSLHL